MIGFVEQKDLTVYVYSLDGDYLWSKVGTLLGYTSSIVIIKHGSITYTYICGDRGEIIHTHQLDMQKKYRKYMKWWLNEFLAGDQVDHYVELFPELDSRLAKFAIGIFMWNMKGLIDINNPDDVSKVRQILKILDQTPGYDFFDNVFNDVDPNTVCGIIGITPITPAEEGDIKFDYYVHEIKSFDDALDYFGAVSRSIVTDEAHKEHTANGNRIYFCCNDDWPDVECVPGTGFPHDKFGYSLIAVEVTPNNKIVSVISRWNTYAGDTGDFLSPEELRNILGEANFNKLFSKSTENEIKDKE